MEALTGQEGDHLNGGHELQVSMSLESCLLEVAELGQILEEALKSPYCQAPGHHLEKRPWLHSYLAWIDPLLMGHNLNSAWFKLLQKINDPLQQLVGRPFEREVALRVCLQRSRQGLGLNLSEDRQSGSDKVK